MIATHPMSCFSFMSAAVAILHRHTTSDPSQRYK